MERKTLYDDIKSLQNFGYDIQSYQRHPVEYGRATRTFQAEELMLQLSVPGIIGMLVISLYSFVDAIFVGRFVGASALGAISLAYA